MMAWQNFSRLLNDRSGNFGMMTAILLPVLLGAAGVALDLTNMMVSKTQLQEAADSAALAASTALASGEAADEAAARELAKQFFLGQASNTLGADAASTLAGTLDIDIKTTTTSSGKSYAVTVGSDYDLTLTPLMGVMGYQSMNIATQGTSTSGTTNTKTAFTMALVLDESGSMAWEASREKVCKLKIGSTCFYWEDRIVSKMEALKKAAAALFDGLDKADPDHKLVRTAVYSYDFEMVGGRAPAWGTATARDYVQKMPPVPDGGTDATQPMQAAITAIKRNAADTDTESVEHRKKQNDKASRYIVLMTDGEMTGDSGKWKETIDNNVRAQCVAAKAGKHPIRVFSVAFKAPEKGKELLKFCATSSEDYFEAETMETLISSFSSIAETANKAKTLLIN